jgi:Zn-dependent protease/predicted transcriptional regulator
MVHMRASIRLGRIAGIPIGLHYSWIVIAVLITLSLASHFVATQPDWRLALVWTSAIVTSLLFFASLVVHELSHALVATRLGLSVRSITLFALGGVAQIDDEAQTARDEFWIAIVGPLASFALGLLCLTAAWPLREEVAIAGAAIGAAMLGWLGYINVVLAIFNLIPAYPLDGGRVLRAILWGASGDRRRATRRAAGAGQVIAFMFMMFGLLQFFTGTGLAGLWLAFIGWFLLDAAQASYLQTAVTEELRDVRVADLMTQDCPTVEARWSLQQFVDDVLLRSGRRCFLVRRDEEVIGLITPHEVQEIQRETWPSTSVASAARPLASLYTVSPDTSASEALRIMSRHDVHQLPVLSDGHLEGLVTRGHLLQLVETRLRLEHAPTRGGHHV